MRVERSTEEDRTCESGDSQKRLWDRISDFLGQMWVLVLAGAAAIAVYPLIPINAVQQALFWIICASLGLGIVSQVVVLAGEGIAWIASRRTKWGRAWSVRTWTSPPRAAAMAEEATPAKPPTGVTAPN